MKLSVVRVLVSLGLSVALFLVFRSLRAQPPAPVFDAAPAVPAAVAPAARAAQISQGPRAVIAPPKENPFPPACLSFFNDLRALDLKTLAEYPPKTRTLPSSESCPSLGQFQDLHDHYVQHCTGLTEDSLPQAQWTARAQDCVATLIGYRARLTDWLTRDVPLSEIRDPQVLIDKLFARFAEDPVASVDVAERLLELEPGLYPAAKAAAMGRFFGAARDGTPEAWERSKAGIERAKRMGQDGAAEDARQIGEMEASAFALQAKSSADVAKHGESLSREKPEWGTGPYLQALAASKSGDKKTALAHLEEAARREPHSDQYRQAIDCLQTTGQNCFRGSASFKLDLSRP